MAQPFGIVFGYIIHRVSAIGEHTTETKIYCLSYGPLEVVAAGALTEDRRADTGLEVLVPQTVQSVLSKQAGRKAQFLVDHQKTGVCTDSGVQPGSAPSLPATVCARDP